MAQHRIAWMLGLAFFACDGGDDGRRPASTDPVNGTTGTGDDTAQGDATADDASQGETTAQSSGPGVTSASDDTAGGTASTGSDDAGTTTTGTARPGNWLLTIDNAASPPVVVRIDTTTGAGQMICALPSASSFNSLALARDGTLYVHNAAQSRIERVDPCDCGFQIVGPTSAGALWIGVDADDGLLGIEPTLDALYTLNPHTGLANAIGPLGLDFVGTALAWSDSLPGAYAIDDATNQLYTLSTETGVATLVATLSQVVTSPGLAIRPDGDEVYVCQGDTLYTLAPASGMLTEIGAIGLAGSCTALAAPFLAESCLE